MSDNFAVDVDSDWGDGKNLGIYVHLAPNRERTRARSPASRPT